VPRPVASSPAGKRYVALLRGINVGTAKRVSMADLRRLVEALGYTDVRTLLNSGNVIFSAAAAAAEARDRIEQAIAEHLDISVFVTVVSSSTFAAVVRKNPLVEPDRDPSRLFVCFLRTSADQRRLERLGRQQWAPDEVAFGSGVVYVWCPAGLTDSKAMAAIARAAGDGVTTRNWGTVGKIKELLVRGAGAGVPRSS
jgi:uncharacterized protein (DUF1697 family)